jgi:hypothetical protein
MPGKSEGHNMRMMMRAKIPVEAGNVGLSEGTLLATLQQLVKLVEPEAAYVGTEDRVRRIPIFFGLKDPSDPTIVDS